MAAKLVAVADQWRWSSCHAHLGQVDSPPWLDSNGLHAHLLGRAVETARDRKRAIRLFAALLGQVSAEDCTIWQDGLRGQIYLGDDAFAERMRTQA